MTLFGTESKGNEPDAVVASDPNIGGAAVPPVDLGADDRLACMACGPAAGGCG
jgi:hypothetical protein